MIMQKLFGVFAVTLMVSACLSHPGQYQSLSVTLKNNKPCFAIPANSGLDAPVASHSPSSVTSGRGLRGKPENMMLL